MHTYLQILIAMEKTKIVPEHLCHLTGGIWCWGRQILKNLSRDTRTVVEMEMVRLIWVRGRRKGRKWGKM